MNSEIEITIRNLQFEVFHLKTSLQFMPDDIPAGALILEHFGSQRDLSNTLMEIAVSIKRINQELETLPSGYRHPHEMKNYFRPTFFPVDNFRSLYEAVKNQHKEVERIQSIIDNYGSVEIIEELNIPQQSASLKLGFDSGKISVLDSSELDNAGNEKALIDALHGPLLETLKSAENTLNQGNKAYGFLADNLSQYIKAVDKPVDTINFGEVFLKAKQIKAGLDLAKQHDLGGEFPEFPPQARIDIEAVLEVHKPFMQASDIGAQIVANAEHYDKTPEELKSLRRDISDLRFLIEQSPNLIEEKTSGLVSEALDVSDDEQNTKDIIFASRVAKNFGIVTLKLSITKVLGAGAALIPGIGPVVGVAIEAVGSQSVKKGGSMDKLLADVKTIGSTSQEAGNEAYGKFKAFVSKNATLLSRTTTLDDDGKWFKKGLKVLKKGPEFITTTITANNPPLLEQRTAKQIHAELVKIISNSASPGDDIRQFFSELIGKKVTWNLFFGGFKSDNNHTTNGIYCQLIDESYGITCDLYDIDMEMLRADAPSDRTEIILYGTLEADGNLSSCRYLGIKRS